MEFAFYLYHFQIIYLHKNVYNLDILFTNFSLLRQVDIDCLKVQIEEKKRRETEQQRINRIFEENLRKADEIAVALEIKEREVSINLNINTNSFQNYLQSDSKFFQVF